MSPTHEHSDSHTSAPSPSRHKRATVHLPQSKSDFKIMKAAYRTDTLPTDKPHPSHVQSLVEEFESPKCHLPSSPHPIILPPPSQRETSEEAYRQALLECDQKMRWKAASPYSADTSLTPGLHCSNISHDTNHQITEPGENAQPGHGADVGGNQDLEEWIYYQRELSKIGRSEKARCGQSQENRASSTTPRPHTRRPTTTTVSQPHVRQGGSAEHARKRPNISMPSAASEEEVTETGYVVVNEQARRKEDEWEVEEIFYTAAEKVEEAEQPAPPQVDLKQARAHEVLRHTDPVLAQIAERKDLREAFERYSNIKKLQKIADHCATSGGPTLSHLPSSMHSMEVQQCLDKCSRKRSKTQGVIVRD